MPKVHTDLVGLVLIDETPEKLAGISHLVSHGKDEDEAGTASSDAGYGAQPKSYAKAILFLILVTLIVTVTVGFGISVQAFVARIGLSARATCCLAIVIVCIIFSTIGAIMNYFIDPRDESPSGGASLTRGFMFSAVVVGAIILPVILFISTLQK